METRLSAGKTFTGADDSWGTCRGCGAPLRHTFVDLGMSPLCESYVSADRLNAMELFYPLHAFVCDSCWLVQLLEYVTPDHIFSEYAYFSSYSSDWLRHAQQYVQMITARLGLLPEDPVIEIASNDGYLLQYFVERGQRVLGVEPAANIAKVAESKGVPTRVAFLGERLAQELVQEGWKAKLLLGNNVLAQVPDLNDFVRGLHLLLAPDGTLTLEFPHLQRLIEGNQFDTIYHEHFSYFSFLAADRVLASHGLKIIDAEELWTHGGSLRIYAVHAGSQAAVESERVRDLRQREMTLGYGHMDIYRTFDERVKETKRGLLAFLIDARRRGKTVTGYGAPGKGNTLLNYCGVRTDFLDYTVDRNPYKQGKYLPGTHIPIFTPERIPETRPDYVLILPWNFRDEIMRQLAGIREWGGRFVIPIPRLEIVE